MGTTAQASVYLVNQFWNNASPCDFISNSIIHVFYTKHCFHAHNNGIVEGVAINCVRNIIEDCTSLDRQINAKVKNALEKRKNIDDIPDTMTRLSIFLPPQFAVQCT